MTPGELDLNWVGQGETDASGVEVLSVEEAEEEE
jgi:hypothetical protein